MTDRPIDASRAGGTGNAAPKAVLTTGPMSVLDALEQADRVRWRTILPRADRAVIALADEVLRIRAALPEILGCAEGHGLACTHNAYGWSPCCATRLRMVRAGLLPASEQPATEDDGA